MLDKLVTALNRLNHNATVLVIFGLGIGTASLAYVLVAKMPTVPTGIQIGFGGLGVAIVGGAMMAFRGSSADDDSAPPANPAA